MKPNVFQETAAAVAKRFGVSVKALRVYEDAGLLKPARTVAGWRIYRQLEIERLSAILGVEADWSAFEAYRRVAAWQRRSRGGAGSARGGAGRRARRG